MTKEDAQVIITTDKGVALVVMDRSEIKTDPTNKLKNKLINLLKKIKAEGGITEHLYKKMYPTGAVAPKFYGLPKIHKRDIPLRPIVCSRGSISYDVPKELTRILRLLVCNSPQPH